MDAGRRKEIMQDFLSRYNSGENGKKRTFTLYYQRAERTDEK